MDLASELEQALEIVMTGQVVEIREDGRRMRGLDGARCEVRPGAKPLVHLWSGERSLVRRVSRLLEATQDLVRLEVERFGSKGAGRLEIARRERPRAQPRIEREGFAERFATLLRQQFPDETIELITVSPDLEHSLSGSYARGWMRCGPLAWAVLGASPSESAATIDRALAFGLIWLDCLRTRAVAPVVAGLRLILPPETGKLTAHRIGALAGGMAVHLYEWRAEEPLARRIDLAEVGLDTWLTPRGVSERIPGQVAETDARIRALAPSAIDAIVVPGTRQVAWRYHGLEFARWARGTIRFGIGHSRNELSGKNWPELERLASELGARRRPDGNRRDPLFRAARQQWLETLVRSEITRIDARLDPAQVYAQVPAISGRNRGVIDLLAATAGEGRLAVVELQADEDVQMILEAVDYWLRVRWHLRQGDFQKFGYFPSKTLQSADPLLYLVAPSLRFHSATRTLMRYLSAEIPICQVGLNEDWRGGLRVIERSSRDEKRGIRGERG